MRIFILALLAAMGLLAKEIKVASYNVENLFDMNHDGGEYEEYIPNNIHGWSEQTYRYKLENIAYVIKELDADIIGLQEVESITALRDLKSELKTQGLEYKYLLFSKHPRSSINNALLSKYPIIKGYKHPVADYGRYRDILEGIIDIDGVKLHIFVNHWKSKSGPESERIKSAKRLKYRLKELDTDSAYILLGDFNSDYEENLNFIKSRKHNDTEGITGLNHILCTIDESEKPITYNSLEKPYHYNLWYELGAMDRWSHKYRGKGEALDNMIIPYATAFGKDVKYIRHSFSRFDKDFLFRKKQIFRWQMDSKPPKRHLGLGYSDHLPIYAKFWINSKN